MRTLGLDLSSANTGYAILDDKKLLTYGSIKPPSKMTHEQKLEYIYNAIKNIITVNDENIEMVAIEDQHLKNNVKTLKLLSKICGIAMLCCQQHKKPINIIPSRVIKLQYGGKGNAVKQEMVDKTKEYYGSENIQDDNICDAIGIAWTQNIL